MNEWQNYIMAETINTITQYDHIFDDIVVNTQFKAKNFCPFFSIITVNNFLHNRSVTKTAHIQNICFAVLKHIKTKISEQLTFDELIKMEKKEYTNKIGCTTTELLKEELFSYRELLPESNKPYAIIFLKNGNFFTILHKDNLFYIRDSHESTQYNSLTYDETVNHLNKVYNFNKIIDIDGYIIPEYSNIEYLICEEDFGNNVEGYDSDMIREKFSELFISEKQDMKIVRDAQIIPKIIEKNIHIMENVAKYKKITEYSNKLNESFVNF